MLPALSAEERAHSDRLAAHIRAAIAAAGGWLSFERFMELALYAPGLGYYSAGSAKLGAGGDFVTAPEVSDLFGRCLARQCAAVLRLTGGQILELGAGTGRMAAALLTELAAQGVLPERYAILEVSADLAARQRAHLARLPWELRERVVWLERLPPQPLAGVMLANEVADALPCRRFVRQPAGVGELGVVALEARGEILFREESRAAPGALARACTDIESSLQAPLPPGYTSEVCLALAPWIATLGAVPRPRAAADQRLRTAAPSLLPPAARGGHAALPFPPARARRSVRERRSAGHHRVGGLHARGGGCARRGARGRRLRDAGRLPAAPRARSLVAGAADEVQRARLAGEARRLILPEEMGEAFKMMALTRALDEPLAAFALQDLRHLL